MICEYERVEQRGGREGKGRVSERERASEREGLREQKERNKKGVYLRRSYSADYIRT